MFELQSKPLTGLLAEVWPDKVIRELPYRELRSAMATAPDDWRAETIAACAIGVPLDELLNLPGRYAGAIAALLGEITKMHGLNVEEKVNGTAAPVEMEAAPGKH